ncbi:glycosyltransferase [Enterobacter cancerogenus]|uniref:glycosyltransferase n=1 Tax=Enterobacter cancerogenus TaxID=69218 RepID=UPI0028B9B8A9|nr:glycosyltransferase [Enterobacter cancerogenus]MDT7008628.1 glycosyltransferase [Enterobacter cancerogenus]WNN58337.1 glycosyltransferase [Enterobacter cancerogenus]
MNGKFETVAVIMAVYDGDDAAYFEQAINSLYAQTIENFDIFLYVDAVHKVDLLNVISKFQKRTNFFSIIGTERKGLAYGLNILLESIRNKNYGYIARMDSDDISVPKRFEAQVKFLDKNKDISVIGSNCIEINGDEVEIFHKKMPETHQDILKIIIKRSPFVHPSIMFRGSIIEHVRYDIRLMNTQDYYLWIDLLSKNHKFYNLQEPLLYFRVDDKFYSRRGFSKVLNEIRSRIYAIKKLKRHNIQSYIYLLGIIMLRMAPVGIKKYCYMRFR